MKRLIALVAVIALAAGMAMAAPSVYGSNGLFRTISAQNAGPMNFGIGAYVYGWKWDNDSTAAIPYKHGAMDMTIVPNGYFSINDMLELSVAPSFLMPSSYVEVGGTKTKFNPSGLGYTRVGLKVSYKMSDAFNGGLYVGYDIGATLADTFKYHGPQENAVKYNGGIDARLLGDLKFGAACLNINAGMYYDMTKIPDGATLTDTTDSKGIYPNMSIPFGVGFSYDMGMITPYAELSAEYVMDTTQYPNAGYTGLVKRGLMDNPMWAGLGVRLYFSGLNVTVGGEYNLLADSSKNSASFNDTEHWHAIFGLAYAPKAEQGPKVAPTGIIAGKVTDSKGKALAATITVAGMTFNADPATGNYTASGIQITGAPVEIKAEMKGYIAKTGSVVLTKKNKKTPAAQDFMLDLKPVPMGAVKGMVKDQLSGAALDGVVMLGNKSVAVKGGAYTDNLQAGDYTAVFQIPGYFEKTVAVKVTDKGTAINDGMLLKKGSVMPVDVSWKLAGNAIVKSINVDMIKTACAANPKANVVVTAYVDRVGGAKVNQKLADNRANTVKAELIKAGVKGEITAKGVVVVPTGKTKAIKEANTKVEVTLQ